MCATKLRYTSFLNGGEGGIRTLAPVTQPNPLAGDPLEPLEYFSKFSHYSVIFLAERVGFEPTAPFEVTGFQDQLLKPLGHLSIGDLSATRTYAYMSQSHVPYRLG